jgi:hypothetical protein
MFVLLRYLFSETPPHRTVRISIIVAFISIIIVVITITLAGMHTRSLSRERPSRRRTP